MPHKKLINYIEKCLDKRIDEEEIKNQLINVGWKRDQIEEAFLAVSSKEDPENKNKEAPTLDDEKASNIQKDPIKESATVNQGSSKIKFALPILFILLIAGVASAFFLMREPDSKSETLRFREQIESSIDNMLDLNAVSSSFYMEVDLATEPQTPWGMDDSMKMSQNIMGSLSLTSAVDEDAEEFKFTFSGDGQMQEMQEGELVQEIYGNVKGEALLVNDKLFGMVEEIPEPLKMFFPEIQEIELLGDYILIMEEFSKEFEEELFESEDREDFREEITEFLREEMGEEIDPEEIDEIVNFFQDGFWEKEVITVINSTEEDIEGTTVERYDLNFSLLNFVDLIDEFIEEFEEVEDQPETVKQGYYCVDSEGNAGEFSGETINPEGNSCDEVFPEGHYEEDRAGESFSLFAAYASAYDTQVMSHLSQIRSNAEQHYYDNDGTYENYKDSKGWVDINEDMPECSRKIMDGEGYGINVADQEYAAWGALCSGSEEFEEIQKEELKEVDEKLNEIVSASVWTDGEYIYKIEMKIELSEEEDIPDISEMNLAIGMEWADFDEPLNLEEPEEYKTLDELEDIFMDIGGEMELGDDIGGEMELGDDLLDEPIEPDLIEEGFEEIGNGMEDIEVEDSPKNAYDTQIKSELTQVRSNAEMHYYDNDGSYYGYEDSDGWRDIKNEIPECSISRLEIDFADVLVTEHEEYQINVEDNEQAQSYVAWAPLCAKEAFFCIDSRGNAQEYDSEFVNPEGVDCEEVFESAEENEIQE